MGTTAFALFFAFSLSSAQLSWLVFGSICVVLFHIRVLPAVFSILRRRLSNAADAATHSGAWFRETVSQNLIDFKANPPFLRQNWQTIPRCLSTTGGRSGRKHHRKRAVPHFRPCEPYILFRPAPLSPHIGFRECRK